MTAPARNLPRQEREQGTPGTDLALSSARVGILPPELQQALEIRKLRNQVAGQLAAQNWGKSLDLDTRRAIADWGQQFRVDVATEIHVLGGNVYLNAAFFLRHLGEMIDAGLVEYAVADHVEDDARLVKLGPEGEGEYSRRLRERIRHNLPEKAASAVVFRIKLRSMDREITGAKACGNGVKKNDPVGDAAPAETSESRAARRAMRMITSHVPKRVADEIERIEASAQIVSDRVKAARAAFEISEASHRRDKQLPPGVRADAPYEHDASAPGNTRDAIRVVPEPRSEAQNHAAETAAAVRDPYDDRRADEERGEGELAGPGTRDDDDTRIGGGRPSAPASEQPAADWRPSDESQTPTRSALELFPMPFGPTVGQPMGDLSTVDLDSARRWAMKNRNHSEFVEKATQLLEDRRLGDATEPQANA